MKDASLAQEGLLSDPTPHVEYLIFVLNEGANDANKVSDALSKIANVSKSIGQKDTTSNLSITTGFSSKAWPILFPNKEMPKELRPFKEMKNGPRHFPSTEGDIFFMIKSNRLDLNYQAAKHLVVFFREIADAIEDVQGFKYLDDRDLIDFVDGTENPKAQARTEAVLSSDLPYEGSSYLTIQKYIDKHTLWDSLTTEEQEGVIGRTKMDDIEIPDEQKKPYAHNVKSKLTVDGVEIKMLRQNRPFGNAIEHGTMFVGFAKSPDVIEDSLKQMITADEEGNYDKLLDFVTPKTGINFFIPPKAFMDDLS